MPPLELDVAPVPPQSSSDASIRRSLSSRQRAAALALSLALLLLAVANASTGTTWFALQSGTPIMKAAWRLQLSCLLQAPLMLLELRSLDAERRRVLWSTLWRLAPATGVVLGMHFAAVALAVQTTSLTHAILACNTAPLFLIGIATMRFVTARVLSNRESDNFDALAEDGATTDSAAAASASTAAAAAATGSSTHTDSGSASWRAIDETADQAAAPLAAAPLAAAQLVAAPVVTAPVEAMPLAVASFATATAEAVTPEASALPAAAIANPAVLPPLPWLSVATSPAPTSLELLGTLLCLAGIGLLVAEAEAAGSGGGGKGGGRFRNATVSGDASGLLASLCLGIYFVASGEARKRQGLPLWCWLCPLNAVAAVATTAASAAIERNDAEFLGALAWAEPGGQRVFLLAAGSAVTAGCLGHGLANFVMATLSPLVVSVGFIAMPLSAIAQGVALGLQAAPSAISLAAAPVIIYGAYLTSVGGRERGLAVLDALLCRLGSL